MHLVLYSFWSPYVYVLLHSNSFILNSDNNKGTALRSNFEMCEYTYPSMTSLLQGNTGPQLAYPVAYVVELLRVRNAEARLWLIPTSVNGVKLKLAS